ncbi:hypothetical protein jhhlp_001112 [Lomentospora prolificans]|uniref:Uncharacterized protein n=1 Tax=Lomentospora prolificans TaxID=41688 RepID=A0A2N3NH79_9PEZI|nr:hypothetical protein jhhlp_001112 [Lomentospora prolificans]
MARILRLPMSSFLYTLLLFLFSGRSMLAGAVLSSDAGDMSSPSPRELRPRQAAGSGCEGSEGQWNCMTDSWQRCADGIWSIEMPCSDGTICSPAGLTYDFEILHSEDQGDGSGGRPPASGGTKVIE